jgi:hypothetical protein
MNVRSEAARTYLERPVLQARLADKVSATTLEILMDD